MIVFSGLVFDQSISGTGDTWYTSAEHNDSLGLGDELAIHAVTTGVSGTGPAITCRVETSANGKDWYDAQGVNEISGGISNDATLEGSVAMVLVVLQRFVRGRVALGGISPACRLKLYATGRSYV
jgi:hypothetical protein